MKRVVAHSGLNKNGVYVTKKALKEAVKTSKNNIPITFEYRHNEFVGHIRDLEYIDGRIYGNVILYDKNKMLKDKVVRLAYRVDNLIRRKKYRTAKKLSIEYSGLIDKSKDAEIREKDEK